MIALSLAVMAAAWLVEAADDNVNRHVHGAVAFIRTGERTPLLAGGSTNGKLSALGAHQMYTLGQMLRGRYIGDNAYTGLGHDPIKGLSQDILDPEQLYIRTLDTPYLQASAQALMQGLYPPYTANSTDSGLVADAVLANGTAIDFPLSGYQYAPIQVLSDRDSDSIYLSGNENCPMSNIESLNYYVTEQYAETRAASESLYLSLNTSLFNGILEQKDISYFNAFEIYDYLSYAYMHDQTVHDTFTNDAVYSGVFDRLRYYADESAWYSWGNTSTSSSDADPRAMAGKTLIAFILRQFQNILNNNGITSNGNSQPLTLLFGEQEPFISLFSLMMLDYHNQNFRAIPPFGSAVVFELFSTGDDGTFPSNPEDLWINFHFHNGSTEFDGHLTSYSFFGDGPSHTDIPWLEFEDMMSRESVSSLEEWCNRCDSAAQFCWGVSHDSVNGGTGGLLTDPKRGGTGEVSPVVGGVIGAIVSLAVAGIVFAAAMLLGGLRFHRAPRGGKKSDLGGFKGSTKLASDADLSLPKNGVLPAGAGVSKGDAKTHERAGSWELRQKEFGTTGGGDLSDESRRESFEAIEAAMRRPVEPTERV